MNILILGSGGREHALAWRLSQDTSASKVFVWPGNAGMESSKIACVNEEWNKEGFKAFIDKHEIKLVVPGAEKFLYEGVSDWCEELKLTCFGPGKSASELENSKLYSKDIMIKAGVATAPYVNLTEAFEKNINEAKLLLKKFKKPVIKISGPALGKGVFVCENPDEAIEVLNQLKNNPISGIEGGLLVEEGVTGKEVSVFYACNGTEYSYLGSAQDHKRLLDQDKGPNTGGMGTVSPVQWVDQKFINEVTAKILRPTLEMMQESGNPFKGVLFLGLMVNEKEINLLEYNVRFGDPETQVLMPLIDGDLTEFLFNFSNGRNSELQLKTSSAVHVVKAAKGYPGTFGTAIEKGQAIDMTAFPEEALLFYAGVKKQNEKLITSGGRVLGVTALGESREMARTRAYHALDAVNFDGQHFRKDIGK